MASTQSAALSIRSGKRRAARLGERIVEGALFSAAFSSVFITLGIAAILIYESVEFFRHVPVAAFLTDTLWTPLFAEPRYGILPLLCGTLLSSAVAMGVAVPLGLVSAVYLSEFAPPAVREVVKPVLEILSGVTNRSAKYP